MGAITGRAVAEPRRQIILVDAALGKGRKPVVDEHLQLSAVDGERVGLRPRQALRAVTFHIVRQPL